ncbi:MAG: dihydropteroate synthase [Chlorobiaceae bacterium]|nr:dihydropteroate synthase [Chlorobiaceae bacterium]
MSDSSINNNRFRLDCSGTILDLSARPAIMGIVNLTPDSFFDGGTYTREKEDTDLKRALQAALEMVSIGAEIIDVGGESTRPGAAYVSSGEEIRRIIPFIELLRKHSDVLISADTYKAEVAEKALQAGANIINDISGLSFDPEMPEVCGRHRCGVVLMHTPTRPGSLQWSQDTGTLERDIVQEVIDFLGRSAEIAGRHGISSIMVDPGLGFGKSVAENFQLLGRLDELHALGFPVLAGLSRKSFLGQAIRKCGEKIPSPSRRLNATISANTVALMKGADIIRVHDVEAAINARSIILAMRDAMEEML